MNDEGNQKGAQSTGAPVRTVSPRFALVAIVVFIAALAVVVAVVTGGAPSAQGKSIDPGPASLGRPDRLPRVVSVLPDAASNHPWTGEAVSVVFSQADARVDAQNSALYVDGAKVATGGSVAPTDGGAMLRFVVGDDIAPGPHAFEVVLVTANGKQARTSWEYSVQ